MIMACRMHFVPLLCLKRLHSPWKVTGKMVLARLGNQMWMPPTTEMITNVVQMKIGDRVVSNVIFHGMKLIQLLSEIEDVLSHMTHKPPVMHLETDATVKGSEMQLVQL